MPDTTPESPAEIKIGERLPGLILGPELPAGTKYWDQIIPSPYGDLTYQQPQWRDTFIRWRTADRKATITVESRTGKVAKIEKQ